MGDSAGQPADDPTGGTPGAEGESKTWTKVEGVADGRAVRVRVGGDVDQASVTTLSDGLDEGVRHAVDAKADLLVVDLDATGFLASVGLSALIRTHQRMQDAGGEMVVVLAEDHKLVRLLWTTALHQVVPVASSLEAALARRAEPSAPQES
ncbi:STAS domain-containing protein [Saccharothrix obliqua]|uniref:STAS domain-containing protein n=1 Tax=Saccharothrix obliqua TaxID=2861747 RepID=UPI001C5EE5D0|nr:STAS domain-containing protein [Saccharothrix obliqua]MBW4718765.1 STAS domain-containing protein [Saccharothrix obliqua]